jgi:hypothetical protein
LCSQIIHDLDEAVVDQAIVRLRDISRFVTVGAMDTLRIRARDKARVKLRKAITLLTIGQGGEEHLGLLLKGMPVADELEKAASGAVAAAVRDSGKPAFLLILERIHTISFFRISMETAVRIKRVFPTVGCDELFEPLPEVGRRENRVWLLDPKAVIGQTAFDLAGLGSCSFWSLEFATEALKMLPEALPGLVNELLTVAGSDSDGLRRAGALEIVHELTKAGYISPSDASRLCERVDMILELHPGEPVEHKASKLLTALKEQLGGADDGNTSGRYRVETSRGGFSVG